MGPLLLRVKVGGPRMVDRQTVLDWLCKDLADDLGWEHGAVFGALQLDSDLGYDSLDEVEFVMRVEEQYGIDVPPGDDWQSLTVGQIADYVVGAIERKASAA